jgi:glutaredoxin
MKHYTSILFLLTLSFTTFNIIAAVNIVECEDEQGNRSFQKICPPESTQVGEKKLNTGASLDNNNRNINIQAILYMIPDCEACDEIREFLGTRNISITEKNVNDNIELQNELTELTGALKVPTTVIGDEVLTGYSRSKFLSLLEAVGYKDDDT